MRPVSRQYVSKAASAGKFRRHVGKTKGVNIRSGPMRGGIRL